MTHSRLRIKHSVTSSVVWNAIRANAAADRTSCHQIRCHHTDCHPIHRITSELSGVHSSHLRRGAAWQGMALHSTVYTPPLALTSPSLCVGRAVPPRAQCCCIASVSRRSGNVSLVSIERCTRPRHSRPVSSHHVPSPMSSSSSSSLRCCGGATTRRPACVVPPLSLLPLKRLLPWPLLLPLPLPLLMPLVPAPPGLLRCPARGDGAAVDARENGVG